MRKTTLRDTVKTGKQPSNIFTCSAFLFKYITYDIDVVQQCQANVCMYVDN